MPIRCESRDFVWNNLLAEAGKIVNVPDTGKNVMLFY